MPVPPRLTFVTIGSRDVQGLADFYKKLGFEVVIDAGDMVAFQLRGALLGIFDLDELGKDAQSPVNVTPGSGIRGFSLAINVDERDDVDKTIEAARAAGARIPKEPIDSSIFPGRSAYFADPEDNYWDVVWLPWDNVVSVAVRRAAGIEA
jgi:predicted lactoylglutathione lyase